MSAVAKYGVNKVMGKKAQQYEPANPHYEVDETTGKRRKRALPEGLTPAEAKLLTKIRKRAYYLDKGINLCGFRVGWTFFLGLVPFLGDIVNALLGYNLIIKPCKKSGDASGVLIGRMQLNTLLATGISFVPFVGDIIMAAYKPNSRNAWLFEEYLLELVKSRGIHAGTGLTHDAQAQQVINRASGGNWSRATGDNTALHSHANSQGVLPPPVPARVAH